MIINLDTDDGWDGCGHGWGYGDGNGSGYGWGNGSGYGDGGRQT